MTIHSSRGRKPVSEEVIADVATVIFDGSQETIVGTHFTDSVEYSFCGMLRMTVGNIVLRKHSVSQKAL
ncbi:hypothetical protein TNCV_1273801 [Trichonephila clavipes]|nr:hypothetical protein TNCV_1273801 [Trichonephila clavipes]